MSDREPTIGDVLVAMERLRGDVLVATERLRVDLRADFDQLRADQTSLRVDLMARMDRLQDAATAQGRDMEALLDLMVTTQKIAEQGREGVRSAQDVGASNTSVLTELLKRVRQLEADVRDLRGKS